MFKHIKIENFQSLRDVEVDLEPFTVIVGATDSGKSAFFRAMSTLISNRRGSEFITYGERRCTIAATLTQGRVTLQRGKTTADNFYETDDGTEKKMYSKLSGTVPEEVSAFLRIPAKDPINLASQFDKPYLLDTKEYSSSDVARILGALTNVNLIFEGARESNRRKGEAATKLRTRVSDVESVTERLSQYQGLTDAVAAVKRAEVPAKKAVEAERASERIREILGVIKDSEAELDRLSQETHRELPDTETIENSWSRVTEIQHLIQVIESSLEGLKRNKAEVAEAREEVEALEAQHKQIIHEEGTCPLCGQTT